DCILQTALVVAHQNTADRLSNEDVWGTNVAKAEQEFEICNRLFWKVTKRSGIAARISGTVVRTNARRSRNLWLHQRPVDGEGTASVLDYNRRRSVANA